MQLALTTGAHCIITSSSDEKLLKAKEVAGDLSSRLHLVNYRKTPNWDVEVLRITGGRGVNHIVEIGGNGTIQKSFKSIVSLQPMGELIWLAY